MNLYPTHHMDKLPEIIGMFDQVLEYRAKGYRPVPLHPLSKAPLHKGFQTREYSEEEWWHFCQTDGNVALLCGGDLVVLDVDSTAASDLDWVLEQVGDTPMQALTPRGGRHLYFRARQGVEYGNGVRLRGKPYDPAVARDVHRLPVVSRRERPAVRVVRRGAAGEGAAVHEGDAAAREESDPEPQADRPGRRR